MFFLLITLAMGLLVPFQTAANSRLRTVVGPAYVSTLVSFSVSTLWLASPSCPPARYSQPLRGGVGLWASPPW